MITLPPKKQRVNTKSPEIERFKELMRSLGIKVVDIAKKSSLSERTISNFIWNDEPLSGHLLRELHLYFNVSIDWLLTGRGSMLLDAPDNSTEEHAASYCVTKTQDPRLSRMCLFIRQFMQSKSADEQVWLEMQLKLHIPQYMKFLEDHRE